MTMTSSRLFCTPQTPEAPWFLTTQPDPLFWEYCLYLHRRYRLKTYPLVGKQESLSEGDRFLMDAVSGFVTEVPMTLHPLCL